MTDAAVFGARGYLGRQLVALLVDHPSIDTVVPVSTTAQGRAVSDEVPSLRHTSRAFVGPGDEAALGAEAAFVATGAEEARRCLSHLVGTSRDLVVDLSRAHRQAALAGDGAWAYGLPEVSPQVGVGTERVANPGCYPTAALLALAPVLQADLVGDGPLVVDGKSGLSGAGAHPREDLHFPEANESTRAYEVEDHDHAGEIQAAATLLTPGEAEKPVRFTPHLVPQTRGLLATVYAPLAPDVEADHLAAAYEKAYAATPGVSLAGEPDTAHVVGANRADLAWTLDENAGLLVARCAIDNLVKGGAGTAVYNMNRALGFPEHAGLPASGVTP